MADLSLARLATNFGQFLKFGIVGGSGTLVNLLVVFLSKKIAWWTAGITYQDAFMNLFGSVFHIRWYHVFMTIAFIVANTWNYQINRMWTFKSVSRYSWVRGFFPFLLTGLGAFVVSQIIMTLLMNPVSPIGLPDHIFDDSTGLRTKLYWGTAISIIVAMPFNFVINKLWTFRSKPKAPVVVSDVNPR
ncbi:MULTISPECIES: GtrA family protein [Corynebacterium]|uniref:Membrane protein n=1 Tax=Corynebacterium flavescens TaxID=28028 RepID=A0A1L7CL92_CORFL|nr:MULTISPECIES: GtrA family protein [Corynebacterium]APT86568.1 membrane protein [Corynebacterium flavescens]KAA8722726.1 GtrA family protein [Corynebacterium flavescens]MDN6098687.1 GtrA family protein [Corynebacterium flavescens]MDN6198478.1 GtrA family protein [Corynebacterium flavescens]MDN6226123.1 GtrA family protein [Corynebacterium flavescens]